MINIFLICCEPHLILRSKKSTLIGYDIKKNYLGLQNLLYNGKPNIKEWRGCISVTNCLVRGARMRAKATSLVATGHILLCQSVSRCRRRWSMQNENSLKIYNWLTRTMFKWAGISCAECRNFDSSRSFRSAVARAKWCTQTHRVSNGIWSPFNWSNLC